MAAGHWHHEDYTMYNEDDYDCVYFKDFYWHVRIFNELQKTLNMTHIPSFCYHCINMVFIILESCCLLFCLHKGVARWELLVLWHLNLYRMKKMIWLIKMLENNVTCIVVTVKYMASHSFNLPSVHLTDTYQSVIEYHLRTQM